jgi:hypothetical protein
LDHGELTYSERKRVAVKFGINYTKIYKLEWDFKSNTKIFGTPVAGYPDEREMEKAIDKFEAWNRSKTHTKKHFIFKVAKIDRTAASEWDF